MDTKDRIQEVLEEYGFANIDEETIYSIGFYLMSFRHLREIFIDYPDKVLEDLFSSTFDSDLVYRPADILELRYILKGEYSPIPECFFSMKFAKKYLQDYPLLLCFKRKDGEGRTIGNLCIDKESDIKNPENIRRIYVSVSLSKERLEYIKNMLKEESINTDLAIGIEVPGLYNPPVVSEKIKWDLLKEAATMEDINFFLLPAEKKIFDFLKQVKASAPEMANISLRVAGGWTRDRLMGKQSKDIDIALGDTTGLAFVQKIKEFDQKNNLNATGKIHSTSLLKVKDENIPESAKLEVAAIEIYGEPIEFVSLRTEVYSEQSRTPVAAPTNDPKQDAARRDLTINSLYYNIETGQVEDYVGALKDFEKNPQTGFLVPQILRTPGDAVKTFKDDPLRILRALRFYSRYPGINIDPRMVEAFSDPEVQALYKKLAPERSSDEIRKIMKASGAVEATKIMFDTGLYKLIFGVPSDWHDIDLDQKNPHHNMTLKNHILGVMKNLSDLSKEAGVSEEERGLLLLSAMFHDFGKMSPEIRKPKIDKATGQPNLEHYQYIGHEKTSADFAKKVMTHMAFEPKERKFVETVTLYHMEPLNREKPTGREKDMSPEKIKKQMGKFLRDVGDLWEHISRHSLADTLSKENMSQEDINAIKQKHQEGFENLRQYREEIGPYFGKPLLDGNRIKEVISEIAPEMASSNGFILEKGKPVHFLKYAIERLIEQQQMRNIKNEQEAEQYIRKNAKGWQGLWKQQQKQKQLEQQKGEQVPQQKQNKNSLGGSNWYKKIKKADASSGEGEEGFGYEQQTPLDRTEDIMYQKPCVLKRYREGAKVRLHRDSTRGGSLWGDQTTGIIKSVQGNEIIVEWQTGTKKGTITRFNVNDPLKINLLVDIID